MISLRPVTKDDIKKIFEWINGLNVRNNSLNPRKIKWQEHVDYWSKRLKNNINYSYIVGLKGTNIGLVRLDKYDEKSYEISILISEGYRGKGTSTLIIDEIKKIANDLNIKELIARVKPNNTISKHIFEKNGFENIYIFYKFKT